jgi:hypothetical protein
MELREIPCSIEQSVICPHAWYRRLRPIPAAVKRQNGAARGARKKCALIRLKKRLFNEKGKGHVILARHIKFYDSSFQFGSAR